MRALNRVKKELSETDRLLEDLAKELIEEERKLETPGKFGDIFKLDDDELLETTPTKPESPQNNNLQFSTAINNPLFE